MVLGRTAQGAGFWEDAAGWLAAAELAGVGGLAGWGGMSGGSVRGWSLHPSKTEGGEEHFNKFAGFIERRIGNQGAASGRRKGDALGIRKGFFCALRLQWASDALRRSAIL